MEFFHGARDTPRRPGFGRGDFGASPCTSGSRTQFGSVGVVDQFSVAAVFARAMVSSCGERVGVCALKLPFCGPRTEPKPDSTANSASFRDCIGAVTIRMQFFGTRAVVVLSNFATGKTFISAGVMRCCDAWQRVGLLPMAIAARRCALRRLAISLALQRLR